MDIESAQKWENLEEDKNGFQNADLERFRGHKRGRLGLCQEVPLTCQKNKHSHQKNKTKMSIQDPSPHLAQQQQHQKCDKVRRSENLTFFKFSKAIFHHIRKMQRQR